MSDKTLQSSMISSWSVPGLIALFLAVFLVTFLPSLQGFDLTDHGFHISQQYFDLQSSMVHSGTELYLGSEIVGHLWLRILDYPVLAWARVGGALLHAVSALFLFVILRRYFSASVSFWSTLFVALWMAGASPVIIHYYTLPATVAVVYLWSIDTAQRTEGARVSGISPWYVVAGILGVLLAFSRLTLTPLILLPLVPIIVAHRNGTESFKWPILSVGLGLTLGALVVPAILAIMGLLGTYTSQLASTVTAVVADRGGPVSSSHGFSELISRYARDYAYTAVLTGGVLFSATGIKWLLIAGSARNRAHRRKAMGWLIVLVSVAAVSGAIMLRPALLTSSWITNIMTWSIIGILIYTAVREIVARDSAFHDRRLAILFMLGVVVVVFSSLGSNTGIIKNRFGFWVPLSVFVAALHHWLHTNVRSSKVAQGLTWAAVAILVLGGSYNVYTNVYRDSPNRFELVHEPDLPALKWTFTTRERAEWLERVAARFESVPTDASVFFVNASPSLYYVLDRPPVVGNSWFFLPSAQEVAERLEEVARTGPYPDVVFAPTFNTLSPTWPDDTTIIEKYTTRLDIVEDVLLDPAGYRDISEDFTYRFWSRDEPNDATLQSANH